jgi:hypothetical protein
LPENPTYIASEDVTIIVPTIDAGEEFRGGLQVGKMSLPRFDPTDIC